MNQITAFPLYYPLGYPRTAKPEVSRFDTSLAEARDGLLKELNLLGAKSIIISSNVALRKDGLPYANAPEPKDRGVAVWFMYQGEQCVLACDNWSLVKDNIQAIRKTVEALRGLNRWKSSDILNRAFMGLKALPEANLEKPWFEVLGVLPGASFDEAKKAYIEKAKVHHPDRGGNVEEFKRINEAFAQAKKYFGVDNI